MSDSDRGKGYYAHPSAIIEENVLIGAGTKVWHHCHIREGAVIGSDVILGKGVYIDCNVVIGDNVKIQNNVSVYQGVVIEDDVFLGPHCVFTNDLYPRANSEEWQVIATLVKKGASIGANATILCGNTVSEYSMVAAGSVLTSDTLPFSLVAGQPARLKGFVCHCGEKMGRPEAAADLESHYRCAACNRTLKVVLSMSEA